MSEALRQMFIEVDQFIDRAISLYVDTFDFVGQKIIIHAKESGNYQNHTFRLRGSIGYLVALDGRIIKSGGFEGEGGEQGRKVATEFIQGEGVELICVAGMSYARYVEAKNYNVLTSAEHFAEQIIPEILKQLNI